MAQVQVTVNMDAQRQQQIERYCTLSVFNNPDFTQKKPLGFDEHYRVLKDKADKVYGKDRRMTPEEYFGKLWYVVEGLYEHV